MTCSMFICIKKNQHLAYSLLFYWSCIALANESLGIVRQIIITIIIVIIAGKTKSREEMNIWVKKISIRHKQATTKNDFNTIQM